MRIHDGIKLDFDDVLIVPKRSTLSSRQDVSLERTFKTRNNNEITGIPIIAANMATGNFNMLKVLADQKMFTAIAKHNDQKWYNKDNIIDSLNFGFYTVGMNNSDMNNLLNFRAWLIDLFKDVSLLKINIDIANGYSQKFANYVTHIRKLFPNNIIMAGNVCTPEMTQELILSGADIVKIGIGAGAVCSTRFKTGVGYPQIDAAIENADCAHGLGALICLDGGMRYPGDVCKAFCANSDFVMIGGMFAGTDECEGEIITKNVATGEYSESTSDCMINYHPIIVEKKYKFFYGMSSKFAQDTHGDGYKEYRSSEGKEELIEYKGPVKDVIVDILGGLRSCGTYIGANELRNFGKCGSFIRVNKIHSRF
jgi:GMP reductase